MEDLTIVQMEEASKTPVQKEDIYLLISSVVLGLLFDILFYNKTLGISYPLFVIAFYIMFLWNLRRKVKFNYNFGWLLSIPIITLSSTYFIFSNQIFAALNFLIIPILIIAQTVLINEGNKYKWFDTRFAQDILYGVFNRALGNIPKLFVVVFSSLRIKKGDGKHDVVQKVLIGLAMSIPLLMIIISLLTSADRVFKHLIDTIVNSFGSINVRDFPIQGILVLLISILVFSYTWSFLKPTNQEGTRTQMKQGSDTNTSTLWDPVISITIMSLINCVYLVFILIQFAYMFGSINNGLPADFTYAEYARRGFFELLMVTLINFSLLLSSIKLTRKDGKLVARVVRILHSFLIICTMVILSSAYLRMSLYEAAYGYTYLRLLTHSFMIFLFVLFVIAFYKVWNEGISLLKPYVIFTIAAYMILNFVNIDVLIAEKNIDRYVETGRLDTHYLRQLSYDSIPELVKLFDEGNAPMDLKGILVEKQNELSKKQAWRSFNLSKQKAKQVLSQ